MALSKEHRRYLLIDQGIGAMVVNFLLNGAIAWLLFGSSTSVPLWGQSSIAGDTLATAFLLPLITCLIVTRMVQRQVAGGRVSLLKHRPDCTIGSLLSERSTLRRGLILGLAGVLLVASPTVLWFAVAGPGELALGPFIWFKASFAAALAAAVTPVIGWLALIPSTTERSP